MREGAGNSFPHCSLATRTNFAPRSEYAEIVQDITHCGFECGLEDCGARGHDHPVLALYPNRAVEMMAVSIEIPRERRLSVEKYDVEWREISNLRLRKFAMEPEAGETNASS